MECEGVLCAGNGAMVGLVGLCGASFEGEEHIVTVAGIKRSIKIDTYTVASDAAHVILSELTAQCHGDGAEASDGVGMLALQKAIVLAFCTAE